MINPNEFTETLNATAGVVYDTANRYYQAGAHEMGELFVVDTVMQSDLGKKPADPNNLLTQKAHIEYRTVPFGVEADEVPILTFSYDELGQLASLQLWSNDIAENDAVYTVYRDPRSTEWVVDDVLSDDECQASEAEFDLKLQSTALGKLIASRQGVDVEALANYRLEQQMVHTGVPLNPELISRLLPVLKQAAADITYV